MSEGYGYDWTRWDREVREQWEMALKILGPYKYRNFEVFRSPKGRWMAFHNTSYGDVRVVDLETCEVVATDVYSKRDPQVYASHTNVSTFVPSYMKTKSSYRESSTYLIEPTGLTDAPDDAVRWDDIVSIPVAFNAWTIWAADYELYVDLLDLRQIDDGIIRLFDKKTSFIIPHGADHVRNYVKFDADSWMRLSPPDENGVQRSTGEMSSDWGEFVVDFTILQERTRDRLSFTLDGSKFEFGDMYEDGHYGHEEKLPWQKTLERREAYDRDRNAGRDAGAQGDTGQDRGVEEAEGAGDPDHG